MTRQFRKSAGQTLIVESSSDALGVHQQVGIGRGKLIGRAIPSKIPTHPDFKTKSKSNRGKTPKTIKKSEPKQALQFLEGASFFSVGGAMIAESGGTVGKLGIGTPPLIKRRIMKVANPPRKPKKIGVGSIDIVRQSRKRDIKAKTAFEKKTVYK